jgi:hypothetical protein
MTELFGTGRLTALDIPAAVDLLAHYLQEVGDDEVENGRAPSVAHLEELLTRATGDDAIVNFNPAVGGLSIVMKTENRQRIERIVRMLAVVAAGRVTVIDGDEVWRYLLLGGSSFIQQGRLALSAMRPMTGW